MDAKLEPDDIDEVIVHQANVRIIQALQKRSPIPSDRWVLNCHLYGNLTAASMPMALYDHLETKRSAESSRAVLAAFGAGLTWAGTNN